MHNILTGVVMTASRKGPIWQQLHDKIVALEVERIAQKLPQSSSAQLHYSAREAKCHKRAELKAITENVMSHFAVLEVDQQVSGSSRKEMDAPGVTTQP